MPESDLGMGSSLGNSALWINTKGTGAIERIFLNAIGQSLVGTLSVRYGAPARPLGSELAAYAAQEPGDPHSAVFPERRAFEIHSAYQRVRFALANTIDVEETTFLPLGGPETGEDDPPIAYVNVVLHSRADAPVHLRVIGSAMLRGSTPADVRTRYDRNLHGLVAFNAGRPEWVRIFGLSEPPTRHGSDFDYGSTYDTSHVHALPDGAAADGDVIGRLQLDLTLRPGERRELCFAIGLYATGEADALRRYANSAGAQDALERSVQHLETALHRGRVLTPDAVINQGALWSKVNMRRVMASYPTGRAFTNDPGVSVNVVIRDSAWFVYGNDHFLPTFSRQLLDNLAQRQYPNGKLPEYVDAVTGRVEDDGLNINDDTPLYILAVNHHYRASGDVAWLTRTYPAVARAARHIMSQVDDRGLIFCTADDPRGEVWGIAGWRNIISGYRINGAVTELNAQCVAALRAASTCPTTWGPSTRRMRRISATRRGAFGTRWKPT